MLNPWMKLLLGRHAWAGFLCMISEGLRPCSILLLAYRFTTEVCPCFFSRGCHLQGLGAVSNLCCFGGGCCCRGNQNHWAQGGMLLSALRFADVLHKNISHICAIHPEILFERLVFNRHITVFDRVSLLSGASHEFFLLRRKHW